MTGSPELGLLPSGAYTFRYKQSSLVIRLHVMFGQPFMKLWQSLIMPPSEGQPGPIWAQSALYFVVAMGDESCALGTAASNAGMR